MKEVLKDFKENPRGKAILFFLFYFVFFVILILFLRSERVNNSYDVTNYEKGDYEEEIETQLLNHNYSFSYSIRLDNITHEYIGKKNQDELFTYQGFSYYHHGDEFYVFGDEWVKTMNPYLFSDFLDIDKIIQLLSVSYKESVTNYDSGKVVDNYLLSTNRINLMFHNIDSDYMEVPNRVVVSKDENQEITQIHFYLDSYCQLNGMCNQSLDVVLSFDEIGKIEDIKNPILDKS